MQSTGHRRLVEVGLPVLAAAAALACGRSERERPAQEIHLERWDGAGMPVVGDIDITVRGFDEKSDLTTATGTVEVVCDPCVIEEHRIPVPRTGRAGAFAGDSLGFPRVDLGMVRGELRLSGGRGEIEGRAAGGPGFEATVTGTITFAKPLSESRADLRLLFRPATDLASSSPQLASIFLLLGRADANGAVPVQLTGTLGQLRAVSRW